MKVLLDENLDHRLRRHLSMHDVYTVDYMGWSGLKNGELLRGAEDDGFGVSGLSRHQRALGVGERNDRLDLID